MTLNLAMGGSVGRQGRARYLIVVELDQQQGYKPEAKRANTRETPSAKQPLPSQAEGGPASHYPPSRSRNPCPRVTFQEHSYSCITVNRGMSGMSGMGEALVLLLIVAPA